MSKFGYETPGGSDQALAADEHFVSQHVCGFDGVLYSMSAYVKNAAVGELFRFSIYSDNSDVPDVLIAQTVLIVGTGSDEWYSAELSQPLAVSNGITYWLGVHSDDAITLVYDSDVTLNSRIVSDTWPYPLQPWAGGSNVTREYSIYANTARITSTRRWIGYKGGMFKSETPNYDENGAATDQVFLTEVVAQEDLTLEKIWCFLDETFTSSDSIRFVMYSDNAGTPDALLGQSDPIVGASTEQWYSEDLQSTIDITEGATYWIGLQADLVVASFTNNPWGWFESRDYYTVGDTYSDGPEDPCNSPPSDTNYGESAMYAEAIEDVGGGSDVQQGILISML